MHITGNRSTKTSTKNSTGHGGRRTRTASLCVIGAGTIVIAGCGTSASESAIENLIERESGENIDLDFGDGGFSVQTEDGEFSIDLNDDGSFTFDSDEGSGSFDIGSDGGGDFSFEGADGSSGNVEVDEDGNFSVTDENGEVLNGQVGDDGSFTVTGDDGETVVGDDGGFTVSDENGESTFESGSDIPDQWPSDVPEPPGLTAVTGTYIATDDMVNIAVLGSPDGEAAGYLEDYAAALADAGFAETTNYSSEIGGGFTAERGDSVISVNASSIGDAIQLIVSLELAP